MARSQGPPRHVLVLVRHGKAGGSPGGTSDVERPLTDRGREQAAATASWLVTAGLRPDAVVVSSAVRAQQTWEAMSAYLEPASVTVSEELYQTSPAELVDGLAAFPEDVATVLFVGHEPVVSATAAALAGDGSDGEALARVEAGVDTGDAVVLALHGAWDDLAGGTCVLEAHHAPPA